MLCDRVDTAVNGCVNWLIANLAQTWGASTIQIHPHPSRHSQVRMQALQGQMQLQDLIQDTDSPLATKPTRSPTRMAIFSWNSIRKIVNQWSKAYGKTNSNNQPFTHQTWVFDSPETGIRLLRDGGFAAIVFYWSCDS